MSHLDNFPDTFSWDRFAECFEDDCDPCDVYCYEREEWEGRDNQDDGVEDCPACEDCDKLNRWLEKIR